MDLFRPAEPTTDPRELLIRATIEQIEALGPAKVTVRAIVAAAGQNIAAVNYYFGSKAKLLEVAHQATVAEMLGDTEAVLGRLPQDPQRYLAELLHYYLEGSRRYPRLSRSHLHAAFTSDDYTGPFPTAFASVLVRLRDAIVAHVPALTPDQANRRITRALSAVLFPALFPDFFAPIPSLDTDLGRRDYARELAANVLAAAD